eukprot:gene19516-27647_t
MAEEPEHVLVHHRVAAAGRVVEPGAEVAVGEQHGDGGGQHRHHRDQQVGGDQPGPREHWHFHQGHAGRAHVDDGDNDVNRAHDGGNAHDVHGEDGQVHARPHLHRQRRIQRPAGGGGAAAGEEGAQQQQAGRRQQPEREVVHACKGHVGGADLQRDHPVGKADEGRHDGAEHHHQAVHGGELVEELGLEELQAGLEQLGAYHQRQHAAGQQHDEGEPQVQRADILVVGGEQPALVAARMIVGMVMTVVVAIQDFGRLNDVFGRLVRPAVARVRDDGGN